MHAIAGMMSLDGRCKTLDASADGYVRAEACVIIRLDADRGSERLAPAAILLAGSAVNQDARSSSLTAPHGPSQQHVLIAAAKSCGIAAGMLDGVEMHGTGTALGDPIEVGALAAVTAVHGTPNSAAPCDLGSAKSLYGHGETAAGVIGIARAADRLAQSQRCPVAHLRTMNNYVASAFLGGTGDDLTLMAGGDDSIVQYLMAKAADPAAAQDPALTCFQLLARLGLV